MIGTDCTGSCKSKYHTNTTVPLQIRDCDWIVGLQPCLFPRCKNAVCFLYWRVWCSPDIWWGCFEIFPRKTPLIKIYFYYWQFYLKRGIQGAKNPDCRIFGRLHRFFFIFRPILKHFFLKCIVLRDGFRQSITVSKKNSTERHKKVIEHFCLLEPDAQLRFYDLKSSGIRMS